MRYIGRGTVLPLSFGAVSDGAARPYLGEAALTTEVGTSLVEKGPDQGGDEGICCIITLLWSAINGYPMSLYCPFNSRC
jgi:hypothetical protein